MGRRKFFIFHCFIAVLFCGILQGNAAQPRATEILERLAAGFRAMDGYGVKFGVVSGDYEARGSYVVEGDSYYLVLGDAEVFADGAVRREVDNRRREVTVTEVDTASRNILNNPVRAFDFLGSEYTPSLVSEADGRAVVRLTPAAGNDSPAGDVTLTVDTATMRPRSLSYDYDGRKEHGIVSTHPPCRDSRRLADRLHQSSARCKQIVLLQLPECTLSCIKRHCQIYFRAADQQLFQHPDL